MKSILVSLFLFGSLKCLSQSANGSDGALHSTGRGIYAPMVQKELRGFSGSVATITERNSIPAYLRDTGMIVAVRADSTMWTLAGGTTNSNWFLITKLTQGAVPPDELDSTFVLTHALQVTIPHLQGTELIETPSVQVDNPLANDFSITSDATNIYLNYPRSVSGTYHYHITIRK